MEETISIKMAGCEAAVTIHRPRESSDRHTAVFYLHGGGLLYGDRDDLPNLYRSMLANEGYTLFCLDYPLAPEAYLARIHQGVLEGCRQLIREEMPRRGLEQYFLFGRSGGAYLALILARSLCADSEICHPAGILDFYGYYDMADVFVSTPSAHYTALPSVPDRIAESFAGSEPVTSGPKALRFSLYVYARQKGAWAKMLGIQDPADPRFSLSEADLAALPPLFITASSTDQDVPFRISKTLSRKVPGAVMKPVYYMDHDFDRDTTNPAGEKVYTAALAWMKDRLEANQ